MVEPEIISATKETFTKKAGPLPVWGWAAIGMGVFFLYSRSKRRSAPSSAESTEGAGFTDMGTGYLPSTAFLSQGYVPSTDETNAKEKTIYTNNDWVREASIALIPSHSDNAIVLKRLRQYLSGMSFPEAEYNATLAIGEEATRKLGMPPPEPFPFIQIAGTNANFATPPQDNTTPVAQNNGRDIKFTLADFGGSIESAADHYFGDPNAWTKFRIDGGPGSDPTTGWINSQSYRELQPWSPLIVGPIGRIRD